MVIIDLSQKRYEYFANKRLPVTHVRLRSQCLMESVLGGISCRVLERRCHVGEVDGIFYAPQQKL